VLDCRPLSPTELEDCLQRWDKGRNSKVWLHVDTVIRECPGLGFNAFRGYLSSTEGRSALQRGFDWYVHRRALTYVFILDRAAGASASDDVVDVSIWKGFEALYIQSYEASPEDFVLGMLEERPIYKFSHSKTFTYAMAVFGLGMASQRTMKNRLLGVIEGLRSSNLLLPCEPDAAAAAEQVPVATPPVPGPSKRLRSGPEEGDPNAEESDSQFPLRHQVAAEAEDFQAESDKGCFWTIMAEEWALGTALLNVDLLVAYNNEGPWVFDDKLKEALLVALRKTGAPVPVLWKVDAAADDDDEAPGGVPQPQRLFKLFDLQRLFRLYDAALVGRGASSRRKERLQVLEACKAKRFEGQLFRPPPNRTLLVFLSDGRKYSGGSHRLVYDYAKKARSDDGPGDDGASPAAKHRASLTPVKAAMLSPNRWDQLYLSHRAILYLQLMKVACGISDNKFLLFQYLLHALVSGEAPDPQELKQICIAGKSHKQRVRQLTWRLRQHKVGQVNASLVKFFSCDLTGNNGVEMNSQHVYYFREDTDAPEAYPLPSLPVGAKDAGTCAEALTESCWAAGVSTHGTQGGCSDNAPNARNTIAAFFDLTERDANGVDENGEVVRTIVNGVVKRLLFVGSPIHQLHLFFQHWRAASVGGKTDMHDPNHLQMVYKFGAILRSDQRISKSGSCNSLYQAIMNEVFGGHPKAKGWWSAIVAQEHEGRWGVSQEALAFAWRLVKAVPLNKAYGNGLAACMMAIRELLKPGCWQLDAAMQVSVWSYAVEIQFAICMENEMGPLCSCFGGHMGAI